jgi:hypothetical protein
MHTRPTGVITCLQVLNESMVNKQLKTHPQINCKNQCYQTWNRFCDFIKSHTGFSGGTLGSKNISIVAHMIRNFLLIVLIMRIGSALGQDSLYYITPEQSKIDVKYNVPFIIRLRSCHSCGSHWNLEQIDTLKVKLVSVTCKNASGKTQQKGGDVFEFWKFIGINAGISSIELVQRGPARDYRENGRCKFVIWVN